MSIPCSRRTLTALAAVVGLAISAALVAPAEAVPNNNSVKKLTKAVTVDGVLDHLRALQDVADGNGGDRAAGRPGYQASVGYVVDQLRGAGYSPTVQEFDFEYVDEASELEQLSPSQVTYVDGRDFLRNQFDSGTPEGEATGPLVNVDLTSLAPTLPPNTSTSGCEAADFAGFAAGSIALLQRGSCGFAVKALNAQAAGAAGAIIMNEGQPGRTGLVGMIGDATGLTIPVVFATFDVGAALAAGPRVVRVKVEFTADTRTAYNVFAETSAGHPTNVVMAGAHLDSVQDGAGINDNGSGSAALLETAIQMQKVKPNNKVRFAWWGAEESGLLGSEYYVATLPQEELDKIALYLNFDMVGSPNFFFGVYDGDDSSGTAPVPIPDGSAAVEDVFEKFYADRGIPFQDTEFSGRSDYGPFIAVDIPAGGLFTGAEGIKTAGEAALYGGQAGVAYDHCYHLPCDDLSNVNTYALDVNSDAIAAAVITLAFDTSTVNGKRSPGKSHGKSASDQFKNRFAR